MQLSRNFILDCSYASRPSRPQVINLPIYSQMHCPVSRDLTTCMITSLYRFHHQLLCSDGRYGRWSNVQRPRSSNIRLIASDVDGTLLNSMQNLTPVVEASVKNAARRGVPVSHWLM